MIRLVFLNSRKLYHIDVETWAGAQLAIALAKRQPIQIIKKGGVR